MDNPYKLDIRKFVLMMLPIALRKPKLYHFIYRMLAPFVTIYRLFYQRRMSNNFFAKYDSSVGNVERMLNIVFPCDEPIKIGVTTRQIDVIEVDAIWITENIETDSAFVGDSYIDRPTAQKLVSIYIPASIIDQKEKIVELAKQYLLPGYGYTLTNNG